VLQELRPNGGQSARDALDRIERKVDQVEQKVEGHINWHMGQS
jgi:phage shock protein A